MPITYILFSKTKKKFYVGSSRMDNKTSRLRAHNYGRVRSTKFGRPWVTINTEHFSYYSEARRREIFLKSGTGRKWVNEHFGYLKRP